MTTYSLAQLLPANIFAVLLVTCRIGGAIAYLPGFGYSYVPVRVKFLLALAIALVVTPVLAPKLPAMPPNLVGLVAMIAVEMIVGAFIGLFANLLLAALDTAGGIIAMQSSLSSAIVFNPGEEKSETLPAGLLSALAVVLIFVTNMHHMLLATVIDSYQAFPAGGSLPFADMAEAISRIVEKGFEIAIQIAAPYIVLGSLFHIALGLVGKIMPQLQIFYVGLPLQVLGGIAMLLITVPASILWFLGTFETLFTGISQLP